MKNSAQNSGPEQEPVFEGLKVIELAGVLAGPSVGYFFAELGAKVLKVENPGTGGDVTRSWKLRTEDPAAPGSAYFWSVNAFKEFLLLDLTQDSQREALYRLVKEADVVITNYKKGDDEKLKVSYRHLSAINPSLIYGSINGFGEGSSRTAYDLILQAESGFMSMNGEPGGKGLKMPVALIDLLAGHQLKEAILIALLKKQRTGKGACISVSLFDSAIASLANQATNWLQAEHLPQPGGSLHPNIAPYGELFDTSDGHLVTLAIGSNRQFTALCEMLSNPALAQDARYRNNQQRVSNRRQLYALLYDQIKRFRYAELESKCLEKDIPFGKVRNLREVFSLPESRRMQKNFKAGKKDIRVVSGIAFRFDND